ncbi:hypothetical protein [Microcoleus sp.]
MTKLLPVIICVFCGSGFYHEPPTEKAPPPGSGRRYSPSSEVTPM